MPARPGRPDPARRKGQSTVSYVGVPKSPTAVAGPMFPTACFLDGGKAVVGVLVTSTRTVAQFTHRVINGRRVFGLFVLVHLIVGRMTTRAIGTVGRRWPGHYFAVAAMTINTAHIGAVIARIIGREVPVVHR